MYGKIYVMECKKGVKVGYSANPKERIGTINSASVDDVLLVFESDAIGNPYEVEQVIHIELDNYRISGEWFSCPPSYAVESAKDVVSVIGIEAEEVDCTGLAESVISLIDGSIVMGDMFSITKFGRLANGVRLDAGLPQKQVAQFFLNDSTKQFISTHCAMHKKKLSSVFHSSRGRSGGTWANKDLFEMFVSWVCGFPVSGEQLSKAIQKAQSFKGVNIDSIHNK